jgi:hypothetical protein
MELSPLGVGLAGLALTALSLAATQGPRLLGYARRLAGRSNDPRLVVDVGGSVNQEDPKLEWLHLTVRNDDEQRVRQPAGQAEIRAAVDGGPERPLMWTGDTWATVVAKRDIASGAVVSVPLAARGDSGRPVGPLPAMQPGVCYLTDAECMGHQQARVPLVDGPHNLAITVVYVASDGTPRRTMPAWFRLTVPPAGMPGHRFFVERLAGPPAEYKSYAQLGR